MEPDRWPCRRAPPYPAPPTPRGRWPRTIELAQVLGDELGRGARERGGHEQQVPLVDTGQELVPQVAEQGQARGDGQPRRDQRQQGPGQREVDEWTIDVHKSVDQWVV